MNLSIKNFKRFSNQTNFEIKPITLFAGANSGGKTTITQALWLTSLVKEKIKINFEIEQKRKTTVSVYRCYFTLDEINNNLSIKIGRIRNFLSLNRKEDDKIFEINYEGNKYTFNVQIFRKFIDKEEKIPIYAEFLVCKVTLGNPEALQKNTSYVTAERQGPRLFQENKNSFLYNCGIFGENTFEYLTSNLKNNVDRQLMPTNIINKKQNLKNNKVHRIFDYWLNEIFPGLKLGGVLFGPHHTSITFKNEMLSKESLPPTSFGFGISYLLPIIVNGILAAPGTTMICENPEAHLHPKAQSILGRFFVYVAQTGVNVVLETHSEHIVNGIRLAIASEFKEKKDDFICYFFMGTEITPIQLKDSGTLIPFPLDFFDQSQQDISKLIKLKFGINA